jgi:tripartite-type tricarboxylate transporter receptor subunit TctC
MFPSNKPLRLAMAAIAAFTATACATPALAADDWPARQPIRLVVPFEAGASTDAVQRFFAVRLSKALNQQIVVENVGGAGGAIGAIRVVNAAPDGYTLLGTIITAVAALPHLQKLAYDPLKDVTPIARLSYPITFLGVNKTLGVTTMQQLIDKAKAQPAALSYASAGIGSAPQFRFEALMAATGTKLTHVPYKGGTAYVADLLAGRVDAFADGTLGASLGKADKVNLLAVLDTKRVADFPDVPAINEVVPAYNIPPTWYLLEGPAGLPPEITKRIATEIGAISKQPETIAFMEGLRARPSNDPADFNLGAEIKSAYDMYGKLIRERNIQAP